MAWDPAKNVRGSTSGAGGTLSLSNTRWQSNQSGYNYIFGVQGKSTGKWYYEVNVGNANGVDTQVGWASLGWESNNTWLGGTGGAVAVYDGDGSLLWGGTTQVSNAISSGFPAGTVIAWVVECVVGSTAKFAVRKDNSSWNGAYTTAQIAAGTGLWQIPTAFGPDVDQTWYACYEASGSGEDVTVNMTSSTYGAPSGFSFFDAGGGGSVTGTFAGTEGADILSAVMINRVSGAVAAVEGSDLAVMAAVARILGSFATPVEGADIAAVVANVSWAPLSAVLNATEGSDVIDLVGFTGGGGNLFLIEGADGASMLAAVKAVMDMAATDGPDQFVAANGIIVPKPKKMTPGLDLRLRMMV